MYFKTSLATLVFAASLTTITTAPASAATINCTVPNAVSCKIQSSKGIQSVKILSNTGQGPIYVVNKSYRSCPKQVTVSWDSAFPASNTNIKECKIGGIKVTPSSSSGLKRTNSFKTN